MSEIHEALLAEQRGTASTEQMALILAQRAGPGPVSRSMSKMPDSAYDVVAEGPDGVVVSDVVAPDVVIERLCATCGKRQARHGESRCSACARAQQRARRTLARHKP